MCFYSIKLLTHILTRPPQMATSIQWLSLGGNQREYSSKPLKYSIVKRVLVFKR